MKKNRTFSSFQDWHSHDVERIIGVCKSENKALIDDWIVITDQHQPPDYAAPILKQLRIDLDYYGNEWNEAEIQLNFIGPLMNLVRFCGKNYAAFAQRILRYSFNEITTQGYVDYMVASGTYEPEQPYFFLHEFKRFRGSEADPLGQLLIAMIAAQHLNNDRLPIYGCFVVGATWRFVLLMGSEYTTSQRYDATDEQELLIIWNILHHTKQIIEERANINSIKK
jgi:hypothetical protein